jgi:cholest-4-en-3-one 26-monooxygenase
VTDPAIDLVDPDAYARDGAPHDEFTWLRKHSPVYWHEAGGGAGWPGFWAITRHSDVANVSRNPQIFSSYRRSALFAELPEKLIDQQRMMAINMDPPQHTRLRGLVNRMFTPRAIAQLEGRIRQICRDLLDRIEPRGTADFVADIATPLPLYVLCELIGAPSQDYGYLLELFGGLVGNDEPDADDADADRQRAAALLYMYASDLARRHQAAARDDVVTRLLTPDERGGVLSTDEFHMFILMLAIAGTETTTFAAAGGMLAFFSHPAQWQRLLSDRSLIPSAAEEVVRWASPVNLFRRTATCETKLGGQSIAEGDKVVVFYSSANRDESVFTDPLIFDIAREPNPHLGFGGGGPHFCLGRQLALLELQVLFQELAGRTPGITLDGPPRRIRSTFLNGFNALPVRFVP